MEQLIKNYQLESKRPLGLSISLAVYGTVATSRHQLKSGYTKRLSLLYYFMEVRYGILDSCRKHPVHRAWSTYM